MKENGTRYDEEFKAELIRLGKKKDGVFQRLQRTLE